MTALKRQRRSLCSLDLGREAWGVIRKQYKQYYTIELNGNMTLEEWKNLALMLQSFATIASFIIGGIWIYWMFIRQQQKYSNIEFLADIEFIGIQDDWWIVELIATVDNKGKAQHKMIEFKFDLNALYPQDQIDVSPKWGGQVNFPKLVAEGSFLPERFNYFFIDPGTKAKYSYIARIPKQVSFVILHCWFKYEGRRDYRHTAEKTVAVPSIGNLKETRDSGAIDKVG